MVEGDESGKERELQWALGKPGEEGSLSLAALSAAQHGKLAEARGLFKRGVESSRGRNFREASAGLAVGEALVEAEVGNSAQARTQVNFSLGMARSRTNLGIAAVASALAGDTTRAEAALSEIRKRYPEDTVLQSVYLPAADAVLKLNRGKTTDSVAALEASKPYELGPLFNFLPIYIRGQAHLRAQQGAEAAHDFQYIIDHRNFSPIAPEYALAYLGLARAYKMSGTLSKSRSAYQDFLALWKDADPDIPILKQAKAEYAKLQ